MLVAKVLEYEQFSFGIRLVFLGLLNYRRISSCCMSNMNILYNGPWHG